MWVPRGPRGRCGPTAPGTISGECALGGIRLRRAHRLFCGSSGLVRDQPLPLKPRGCSALTAASTLVIRGVVHTKVNAVVPFCFIDKKIFQHVLPVCWGERFFADFAMNQAARKLGVGTHTNQLVA